MEDPQSPQDAAEGVGAAEGPQEVPQGPQEAGDGASEVVEGVPEGSILAEPPSVFDELGAMQAEARKDDTKVFELIPGRFRGRLAVRCHRLDPKKRKKKVRKLAKRGVTDEVELQYAAEIIAEATDAILYRAKDSDELVEAQTLSETLGDTPIKWESRLGLMVPPLGAVLSGGESEATVVRLLFKNPEALDAFYQELDVWLREAAPSDDDEEDGDNRPT